MLKAFGISANEFRKDVRVMQVFYKKGFYGIYDLKLRDYLEVLFLTLNYNKGIVSGREAIPFKFIEGVKIK